MFFCTATSSGVAPTRPSYRANPMLTLVRSPSPSCRQACGCARQACSLIDLDARGVGAGELQQEPLQALGALHHMRLARQGRSQGRGRRRPDPPPGLHPQHRPMAFGAGAGRHMRRPTPHSSLQVAGADGYPVAGLLAPSLHRQADVDVAGGDQLRGLDHLEHAVCSHLYEFL
jgi:hypothetical protein